MKKIATLIICLFTLISISKAQYVNIADSNFRNFLMAKYPTCFNASKQMDTTCSKIVNADSLDLYPDFGQIYSTDGLRYFKNLKKIRTGGTNFTELPDSLETLFSEVNATITFLPKMPNTVTYISLNSCITLSGFTNLSSSLKYLSINDTRVCVGSMPQLPNSLEYFSCNGHSVNTCTSYNAPVLPNGLRYFDCLNCGLQNYTNLADSLEYLDISITDFCGSGLLNLPTLPQNLKTLKVGGNVNLTTLPSLPSSLEYLNCSQGGGCSGFGLGGIHSLPILPNSLTYLNCSNNDSLKNLPTLPNQLDTFICKGIELTSLPGLPNSLKYLDCSYNKLQGLPILPNGLTTLNCYKNEIKGFINTLPDSLIDMDCGENKITGFRVFPERLIRLGIGSNPLKMGIPHLPNSITNLGCSSDSLYSLPNIPTHLEGLNAAYNLFSELPPFISERDPLSGTFFSAFLNDNPNLSCLFTLPKNLVGTIDLSYCPALKCVPNKPSNYTFNMGSDFFGNRVPVPPLCNPTNNPNHCASFPSVQGKVFTDMNTNSRWDNNEYTRSRVKISLSNGNSTFTNNTGHFELGTDSMGSYTVSITNPALFNALPQTFIHNFSRNDTLVLDTFALQPTAIKDSLSIIATPINWAARPGFSYPYLIAAENVGTTIITNSTINFIWDSTTLILDSIHPATAINTGNTINLIVNNFLPGQMENIIAYCRVKSTTHIGDSIVYWASINSTNALAKDSGKITVRGSYDPNEKQATPVLTPLQVATGKYISYTINFQNTGTDTAFNVVIADTLSNNVLPNTLQILNSSHNCKTTVNGNKIFFEFLNINLPDSNIDEKQSHGFVSFKVKPKPTLVNGNKVENKAFIYFDYNAPIVTNTAITQINISGVVTPVNLSFYEVQYVKDNVENSVLNKWSTSTETNVLLFNIQRSYDGKNFKTFGKVLAKNKASNYTFKDLLDDKNLPSTLYYRLQIIDKDGSVTYSQVKTLNLRSSNNISIYPNPTKDIVTVACANAKQLLMIDCLGKIVKQLINITQQLTINTKQFHKGVYVIKIITNSGEVLNEKLVIE